MGDFDFDDVDRLLKELEQQEKKQNNDDNKIKNKMKDINTCEVCNSINLISDIGGLTCKDCGTINKFILDDRVEYTGEGAKDETARCGNAKSVFFPSSSQATTITAKGYSRLSYINSHTEVPYKEKSLAIEIKNIQKKCSAFNVNQKIIDNTKIFFNIFYKGKHESGKNKGKSIIVRQKNRDKIITGCFHYGAIIENEPYSNFEISQIFGIDNKSINKGISYVFKFIDFTKYYIPCPKPFDFVERNCKKLNIDKKTTELTTMLTVNIDKLNIASTHEPLSRTACCIISSLNFFKISKPSKEQIIKHFNISEVTINKTLKEIEKYFDIISNKNDMMRVDEYLDSVKKHKLTFNEQLVQKI